MTLPGGVPVSEIANDCVLDVEGPVLELVEAEALSAGVPVPPPPPQPARSDPKRTHTASLSAIDVCLTAIIRPYDKDTGKYRNMSLNADIVNCELVERACVTACKA